MRELHSASEKMARTATGSTACRIIQVTWITAVTLELILQLIHATNCKLTEMMEVKVKISTGEMV